jgi:protein-S-isoprenylcysteine O-methyltransferase Ste14
MHDGKVMPTLWLLLALVAQAALHVVLPLGTLIARPWSLVGLVPLAAGVLLNLIADGDLRKANTTVKPFEESSALVTTGAYGWTRNPMYVGFVDMLVGIALMLGSLSPLLVVPPFAWWMDRAYIDVEERMMAETFGQAWDEYRQRVRRWV